MNFRLFSTVLLAILAMILPIYGSGTDNGIKDSTYAGKRVALLGDSMTAIGGDSCSNKRGWSAHFKEAANALAIDVYARSGATWTNTSQTKGDTRAFSAKIDKENVIYSQAKRLVEAFEADSTKRPDIIFIYAGANDAWFASRRPDIFKEDVKFVAPAAKCAPSSCTSLTSSVELVCRLLGETFPEARIVLMTPAEMTKATVARVNSVGDIIETVGHRLGLKVLRADKGVNIRRADEMPKLRFTTDGVHTNKEGAKLISEFVLSNL